MSTLLTIVKAHGWAVTSPKVQPAIVIFLTHHAIKLPYKKSCLHPVTRVALSLGQRSSIPAVSSNQGRKAELTRAQRRGPVLSSKCLHQYLTPTATVPTKVWGAPMKRGCTLVQRTGESWLSLPQTLAVASSSPARGVASCLPPFSRLSFCLAWAHAGRCYE